MTVALPTRTLERERELAFSEVVAKHPDIPRLIILKTDVQKRGVNYTQQALSAVDPAIHQIRGRGLFGSRDGGTTPVPSSLLLRDGTSIIVDSTPLDQNPYLVDFVDGRFALVDNDTVVEYVKLWEKPLYYNQKTSSGIPMSQVVSARPQRLSISLSSYCHFWTDNKGCRYCDINSNTTQQNKELGVQNHVKPQDITETIREALKEKGRFSTILLSGGSVLAGKELFDKEVDGYIKTLQVIGENFSAKKFPSQLIASPFNEKQLLRLYEETGLMSYTSKIEVLNEEKFKWIVPGKADNVGYQEWKRRLIVAVGIFGKGNVSTGIVGGVELAKPLGFPTEDEALRATIEEAESFAEHGIPSFYSVWKVRPGSDFRDQKSPSLDYFVRLASGLHKVRVKYGLTLDFDDYRRCGNHPDIDLSRLQ
jgi:hypothetical protein